MSTLLASRKPRGLWLPAGAPVIDWTHPVTRGLVGCWVPSGEGGATPIIRDLVSQSKLSATGSPQVVAGTSGLEARDGSGNYWSQASQPSQQPTTAASCLWFGRILSTGGGGANSALICDSSTSLQMNWGFIRNTNTKIIYGYNLLAAQVSYDPATATGGVYAFLGSAGAVNSQIWAGGLLRATTATAMTSSTYSGHSVFVGKAPNSTNFSNAGMMLGALWNRQLTPGESALISADPTAFLVFPGDTLFAQTVGKTALAAAPFSAPDLSGPSVIGRRRAATPFPMDEPGWIQQFGPTAAKPPLRGATDYRLPPQRWDVPIRSQDWVAQYGNGVLAQAHLSVSKLLGYAVLNPPNNVAVSKLLGYAVLQDRVNGFGFTDYRRPPPWSLPPLLSRDWVVQNTTLAIQPKPLPFRNDNVLPTLAKRPQAGFTHQSFPIQFLAGIPLPWTGTYPNPRGPRHPEQPLPKDWVLVYGPFSATNLPSRPQVDYRRPAAPSLPYGFVSQDWITQHLNLVQYPPLLSLSKLNGYAVLSPPNVLAMAKLIGYAVLQDLPFINRYENPRGPRFPREILTTLNGPKPVSVVVVPIDDMNITIIW